MFLKPTSLAIGLAAGEQAGPNGMRTINILVPV